MNRSRSFLPLTEIVTPADQAAVPDCVRAAAEGGTPLYPIGGGTRLGYGAQATRPGWGLSLAGLRAVLDYPARDLTITVQAGVTIAELSGRLAAEGQRLPVDVPQAERATVAGAVATNVCGPRRYRWGTLRDYVIGITAVDGTGMVFSGGGRVVKNAAGYDLCRLLTGSLGTLGIITQVTLMVKPLPEASALVSCAVDDFAAAERLLADLVRTKTLPSAVEFLAGPAWRDEPALGVAPGAGVGRLLVGFEGSAPEVDGMVGQLQSEWARLGVASPSTCRGEPADRLWQRLVDFSGETPTSNGSAECLVEIRALPEATMRCVQQLLEVDPAVSIQAHAGSGVIRARLSFAPSQGVEILQGRLRAEVAGDGGTLVVLSRPADSAWDRHVVWGLTGQAHRLMQRIKDQFDPRGILNPGRFVFPEP